MKALIQRVLEALVAADGKVIGRIGPGLVVFLGVSKEDGPVESDRLAGRVLEFRIFEDETGRMNRSVLEIGGQLLVVSQFTLVADVEKGRRPNFTPAAEPEKAEGLYHRFLDRLVASGLTVETGFFGARMIVTLHNDGPVTFLLES